MKNDVIADNDVQFSWCLIGMSLEVSEDRAEELLEMCIDKWITIRGFLFANSVQELFKPKDKKGTGKAKAITHYLPQQCSIIDFIFMSMYIANK